MADTQRARPTWFISVPRLWSKFQLGVLARIEAELADAVDGWYGSGARHPAIGG